MAITLEMPNSGTDLDTTPPFTPDPITTHTAATAADLLERGETEGEPINDVLNASMSSEQINEVIDDSFKVVPDAPPVADESTATTNGKPKRKRKAKADNTPINLTADQVAPEIAAQLTNPLPELSARMADLPKIPSVSQRRVEISATESDYVRICLQIQNGEDLIEETKGELKILREKSAALASRLRHLCNDEAYQPSLPMLADPSTAPLSTHSQPTTPVEASASQATTHAGEPEPSPAVAAPADPSADAWRAVSINSLGLPPKLAEKLTEENCETIGRLESLRGEISQGRAKWPKGIGLAKVTIIEDAMVKWLTVNRDKTVFAEAGQPAATAGVEKSASVAACDAPPAAVFDDDSTRWPIGGEWEDLTEQQQKAFIDRRADIINDGSPSCLDRKHPKEDRFWATGYKDSEDGEQITDCIYVPGIEQDDYLRGYMAAKAVEDYPTAGVETKEPPSVDPASVPQSLAAVLGDFDDI